jgi:ubiquinone biosynthesis protein UbiJ
VTPQQSAAITLHRNSAHGRDNIRDSDLARLAEQHPHLSAVFEEVQWLRAEVERLTDEMERLRSA